MCPAMTCTVIRSGRLKAKTAELAEDATVETIQLDPDPAGRAVCSVCASCELCHERENRSAKRPAHWRGPPGDVEGKRALCGRYSLPLVAAFIDRTIGFESSCDLTRMSAHCTDIVKRVLLYQK